MKHLFFLIWFFLIIPSAKAQANKGGGTYGNKNYRPVMGGGQKVTYDTKTSLSKLIKRFEKPWKLVETGKSYWIGYTDDMYSIARYGDNAIKPLINFIDNSSDLKARLGALYTLHLIGIEFNVVGRFSEDFKNKNARNALLRYLSDKKLNETVVSLLMRDPWLSDVPKLLEYLSGHDKNYSKVLAALQRYKFEGKPLGQDITDTFFKRVVDINCPMSGSMNMIDLYPIINFENKYAPHFIVDKEIKELGDWKKSLHEMAAKPRIQRLSFDFLISSSFSFTVFNELYDYSFQDHTIKIYGPVKCRELWLNWWSHIPQNKKGELFLTDHVQDN